MGTLQPVPATRIVADGAALEAVNQHDGIIVMPTAPDEVLLLAHPSARDRRPNPEVVAEVAAAVTTIDRHAIVADDAGWCGLWMSADAADAVLDATCAWARPPQRPAFAQGMVAHQPVKLWLEEDRTLFLMPHVVAVDFAHALDSVGGAAL